MNVPLESMNVNKTALILRDHTVALVPMDISWQKMEKIAMVSACVQHILTQKFDQILPYMYIIEIKGLLLYI